MELLDLVREFKKNMRGPKSGYVCRSCIYRCGEEEYPAVPYGAYEGENGETLFAVFYIKTRLSLLPFKGKANLVRSLGVREEDLRTIGGVPYDKLIWEEVLGAVGRLREKTVVDRK